MLYCLHFSPCGSTKDYANKVAGAISQDFVEIDLTRTSEFSDLSEEDILVVAAPVYGGRIPGPLAEKLKQLKGNKARAVTMVVYGNRAYDDALLELNNLLSESGFNLLASAAFVARHVFHPMVAVDRPDKNDFLEAENFGRKAKEKADDPTPGEVNVPGNVPYREFAGMPVAPIVNPSLCFKCGTCVINCPVGAISKEDPTKTDAALCVNCMRCVENCPAQARELPEKVTEMLLTKLSPLVDVRRANEFFF